VPGLGLGFRVQGLGSGFRVQGLGFRVLGFGFAFRMALLAKRCVVKWRSPRLRHSSPMPLCLENTK